MKVLPNFYTFAYALWHAHRVFFMLALLPLIVLTLFELRYTSWSVHLSTVAIVYPVMFLVFFSVGLARMKRALSRDEELATEYGRATDSNKGKMIVAGLVGVRSI
jgi:hypothetical protein